LNGVPSPSLRCRSLVAVLFLFYHTPPCPWTLVYLSAYTVEHVRESTPLTQSVIALRPVSGPSSNTTSLYLKCSRALRGSVAGRSPLRRGRMEVHRSRSKVTVRSFESASSGAKVKARHSTHLIAGFHAQAMRLDCHKSCHTEPVLVRSCAWNMLAPPMYNELLVVRDDLRSAYSRRGLFMLPSYTTCRQRLRTLGRRSPCP
jgi:hypothetical protein